MRDFKKYKQLVYSIIGSAMTVHKELRWGLLEAVYNEALHIELKSERGIDNQREVEIPCFYKSYALDKKYRMDIVVGDIIVELKSVQEILPAHRAQLFNYLRLTKKPIGILINFGASKLQSERYAYLEDTNECILVDSDMNLLQNSKIYWSFEDIENEVDRFIEELKQG